MLLRIEFLLRRAHANLPVPSPWAARTVLDSLIQLQELLTRFDARQDLLKMLERHQHHLEKIRQSPQVDTSRVETVLEEVRDSSKKLHGDTATSGMHLRRIELVNGLRQSAMVPGGAGGFEHPYLHYWLHRDAGTRERDLRGWMSGFESLEKAANLALWLTRAAGNPQRLTAEKGFYNQHLDRRADFQMARVTVSTETAAFANISGNPHRITLRFMRPEPNLERASQTENDVEFDLTLCPGIPQHAPEPR
jgi:cell division protein ZapD